MHRGKLERR